jgi:branched-chain amino acid transport system substrate-binding protein
MRKAITIITLMMFLLVGCGGENAVDENSANNSNEEVVNVPVNTNNVAEENNAEESDSAAEEVVETTNIKIGVLNPTTGGLALFGNQANQGIQLYFDNNSIENVEIELVYADTAGDPQQALDQARRLVESEEVDMLLGLVNSAVAVPIAQYADESETPLIIAISGAQAATDGTHPFVVRTSMANGQQDRPLGWYTANELGLTSAASFAWDFLVGSERAGSFEDTFTAEGGEILYSLKPALGTADYGPFISQVNPDDIDVIYAFFAGPGAISFTQQLSEFGYTPGVQVVASGYYTAGVLGVMGAGAEGFIQSTQWISGLDTPENLEFLSYFGEAFEGEAGVYIEEGYFAAEVLAEAISAASGNVEDSSEFMETIRALDFVGTPGTFHFDENGQAVRSVYITEIVVNDDGSVSQEIITTIDNVDLNWVP